RDRGLPFDPDQAPVAGSPEEQEAHALVRSLERYGVDQAQWVSLGPEGMELRLLKKRPLTDVTEQLPGEALAPYRTNEPRAPEQRYTIRLLEPGDAIGVAQVIYRTYGYTYPNPDLYYPERIIHLNQTG